LSPPKKQERKRRGVVGGGLCKRGTVKEKIMCRRKNGRGGEGSKKSTRSTGSTGKKTCGVVLPRGRGETRKYTQKK